MYGAVENEILNCVPFKTEGIVNVVSSLVPADVSLSVSYISSSKGVASFEDSDLNCF